MLELIILMILKEQMLRINGLFDNNYNSKYKSLKYLCPEDFSQFEQLRETLKPYSRKMLYELQEQNPNLIIFPADIQDTKDKIHDSVLYTLENEYGEYPEETEITTSNLMGFFGIDSYEIHIHSRFDEKYRNDNFLHFCTMRSRAGYCCTGTYTNIIWRQFFARNNDTSHWNAHCSSVRL